jgi:hypothetical protein
MRDRRKLSLADVADVLGIARSSAYRLMAMLWLHEQDISAMLADGTADAIPPRAGRWPIPIHQITICEMGLPRIDNCDLESISRVGADERHYVSWSPRRRCRSEAARARR